MEVNMDSFDTILASGYYVFREDLDSKIISIFMLYLKNLGIDFKGCRLEIKELRGIIEFHDSKYTLNDKFKMSDISYLIDDNWVLIFNDIKNNLDLYNTQQKVLKK